MDALGLITSLTALLLAGLLVSLLSKHYRMPNILLLLLLGYVLGKLTINGIPLFQYEEILFVGIAILSLVVIVFSGASTFEYKALDKSTTSVLRLVGLFMAFNLIFLTFATHLLFFREFTALTVLLSAIFAALMSGTDAASVLSMFKDKANRVLDFLKLEAIFNTPFTVIIPFILLQMINVFAVSESNSFTATVANQTGPFLLNILVGLGSGVLVSLIVLRLMRKFYNAALSPTALLTAALLSYVLAENLQGDGVIAVATLGFSFANIAVKNKESLQEFNFMLSGILEILVFVLVGMIININLEPVFLLKAFLLFIIGIIIRALTINVSLNPEEFTKRERWFIILNMPKGLAVAVVILTLGVSIIGKEPFVSDGLLSYGLQQMLDLSVMVTLFSLILSSILSVFSKRFIRIKIE